MGKLYDILKASKLGAGASPDMYTAIFAQKINKGGSGGEAELSGVPPLTFTADGTLLIDYLISGNTTQSGTPTPEKPIMPQGTGERTGNICNPNLTRYEKAYSSNAGIVDFVEGATYLLPIEANKTYTVKIHSDEPISVIRVGLYNNDTPITGTFVSALQQIDNLPNPTITVENSDYKYLYVQITGSYIDQYGLSHVMINTGSTPLPYEKYGYKIPIICGGTITAVYIGTNPLRKSLDGTAVDELSSNGTLTQRVDTDGSVLPTPIISQIDTPTIPTTNGSNTLDVDTTVKPSEVYIKYRT